ncbi:hypothetical protein EJ02DRAFT_426816 [Clathrospora elynae]|uniref:AMP-activated protein kinase glycogen-binding domain-containing protein n=1 Tax=Clathrospora elynae TaxID=706981 RepID=A0A6A5SCC4_9PLEO|nr:hypothetical protein EJ02DRAFT_426816 [Clathrospora elynae]
MTGNATITFSQTGVQPPVYVTTALSGWETLEMSVDREQTASEKLVFTKHFDGVDEGSYQYKIRIGEDHWILDESQESDTDQQGNRNNVVHVKPATDAVPTKEVPSDVPLLKTSPTLPTKLPADCDISAMDLSEPPVDLEPPKSPEIPLLVVEKIDDRPSYGDDFGEDATSSQKVAHNMRAADASPDKLLITPDHDEEPDAGEEQTVPLFRHESFQADDDIIDEESTKSSTDQTICGSAMDTPSDAEDAQDSDELNQGPRLTHGADHGDKSGELGNGPLLPHETEAGEEDVDKLVEIPLLPHETGSVEDSDSASYDEDELDRYPLLSHETGFSDSKGSEIVTKSDFLDDEANVEPQHYGPYDDDEDDNGDGGDDDTPLLPHERDSAIASNAGSDLSQDEAPFTLHGQPTFGYETDNARELFGGSGRPNFFRTRTNSSNLPHQLPLSDADDDNLNDPSLERFPTSREQILERVATIGLHLPADETMDDSLHSPDMSVLSQACSSVDLAPVKSYISLASVPEAENSDEDEDDDLDSLPSPVYIGKNVSHPSNTAYDFARDPHATPMAEESKQLGEETNTEASSSRESRESSEAESVNKHDGAKDISRVLSTLRQAVAVPTNVFALDTPPLTPEKSDIAEDDHPVSPLDSELRQRHGRVEEPSAPPSPQPAAASDNTDADTKTDLVSTAKSAIAAQQPNQRNENFLQTFFRIVFGPVGRFLTACVGDRKRASASALALGVVVAAYYFVARGS